MKTATTHQKENQYAIMHDELVGEIHDRLLDDAGLDLAHAFNAACVHIAELYKDIEKMERRVSAGYIRKK